MSAEEMAPDAPAAEPVDNPDNTPVRERVESKTWKTRMEAFVELATAFSEAGEGDGIFDEYTGLLSKFIADSNVNAQDKGIAVCCAFAKKAPTALVKQVAASVMSKTVDKAFGQSKCKPNAQELALLFIEAEAGEHVTDELIKGCGSKQPKIAGASAECLRMAVQSFGLRALGPQSKAIVKLSVTLFDSTVQPVRSEALPLAVELHKYMGAALRPSYDGLRTAQQKEIDDAFASAEKPAPARMTRSVAAVASKPVDAADGSSAAPRAAPADAPMAFDASDFADPVDVLSKLPKDFCEKVLTLPKWTEKKEMLDVLIQAASTPKIVPGDYHELVKTLKKLMADSMVVVVTSAVTAAGLLATGLRKEFSQCTKLLLSTLLDRLKEKDFRVRDAVHAALENMIGTGKCVAMADVVEDFCTALGPKGSPKAKVEIYRFLHKSITQANGSIALKAIKPLTDALVKGVDDSAPEVREGSSSVLGALLTAFGADSMKKVLESLDEKKRKKVESMATGPQAATAAPEPAAAAKPVVALKKAPVKASDSEGPKKTAGKVAVSKPATAGAKPKAAGEKQEAKTEIVDLNAGMSVEELDAQMETLYSEATRTKLASANWKERLEGMEEVLASLVERGALEQPVPDATCRMVQGLLVTKKETNFQVVAKGFEVVKLIAEKAGKFSKRAAHWLVTPLVEKLGDVKLKTAASECLTSLAEACSPDFMLSQALGVLEKTKAPKTLENAVGWINTLCGDFGMKLIKPTPVLVFVKGMLEVANPAVKKAAIQALVTLRRLLGPDLRNMLSDVKPALLTSIDEAFAKVADEEPMEAPKRQVRCVDEVAGAAAAGPGDEIVNLTAPIAAHIKALGDANWKERQSAIVAIDELVTKAKPLGCQGPYMEGSCGEMWAALKARLKDSNKNLATQVLALLGKIADAVGPSVDKYSKHVMPNMLALISDNKKTVRDAVVQCLAVWARHISSETVIKYLPIALTVESPAGREDAFKWAADYLAARDKSEPVDLTPILVPVMDGLVFRTAEVRNGAERCLSVIYEGGGKQAINNVLRDMKPAQLKGVKPICEKAEKAAASATTSAAPTKEVAAISIESPPEAGAPGAEVVGEVKPTGADVVSSSAVGKANNKAASLEPAPPVEVSAADEHGKLLRCNRGKDVREKKNGKTKWVLEDAKEVEELIVLVKEQMEKETDSQLHAKLFHKDFKKQVDGIKELTVFAPQHAAEVIDNLDLLLRMCSLRMVQKACNTSVLLAVLELLKALTDLCVANTYYLTETEANVILPVLLQEIGSNNESIRGQMREVVKKVTHVYPASKMFSFAMDAALNTRNQRSKAEVLAEMAALVDRLGLDQVCVPCKALPMMASMIGERDVLVRNAACDFFAAAFSSIGDKIWKYIDKKLEPKDKDILEARLKKVKTTVPASAPAAKPGAADLRRSMPEMAASEKPAPDVRASVNLETARSVETPLRRASKHQVAELLEAPTPTIHNIRSRFQEEHNVESVFVDSMRLIAEGDVEEQIAAFRALSDSIDKVEGKLVEKNFNAIASCVQMELARLLADSATSSDFRLAKHAIHTLHQVFEKQPVAAQSLKDCTTGRLLEEILLLSIELQSNEDAKSLLAGLNEVMMDTLHSANPNHCFTSLIRFLYEGANLSGERVATPEFVDNALRALLEMARSMQECMGKLDVDMLLYDCHMFLVSHPPSKYRGKEFRPLRLLKTILNELVKIKGGGIRDHLTLVPVETKPTLCSYIELVLQQHLSSQSRAAGDKSDSKLDIASIFDKIGSKEKDVAKEGFKLLYQYQKENVEFNLQHFLAGRSPLFQEHVHKNLAKVAANQQGSGPGIVEKSTAGMPLQPASISNLNREANGDAPKDLMNKLHSIRSTLMATSSADTAPHPPTASAEEPSNLKSVVKSSSSALSSSTSGLSTSGGVEGGVDAVDLSGMRASQSVLSLQERLARLRA